MSHKPEKCQDAAAATTHSGIQLDTPEVGGHLGTLEHDGDLAILLVRAGLVFSVGGWCGQRDA